MNVHAIEKTELNKILSIVSGYCTLESSAIRLTETQPNSTLADVRKLLSLTAECVKLLFEHGVSKIE